MPSAHHRWTRRTFQTRCLAAGLSAWCSAATGAPHPSAAPAEAPVGAVRGEPTAEEAALAILKRGGNVADAIVTAAFTAAVAAPHQTGLGGYGGHAVLAFDGGQRVVAVDFNSMAPAAARPSMFPLDAQGDVVDQQNMYGYRAAGVPGIPAGLQLILSRFGTRPLGEVLKPAIALAEEGFPLGGAAAALRASAAQLGEDAPSRALYFREGRPLAANDRFRNPELARLLQEMAEAGTVETFYRGKAARQIAAAFRAQGGLVTEADLAAYEARLVEPLTWTWGDWTVWTAPLTAGGLTVVHILKLLQALRWESRPPDDADACQLQVEAMRWAWQDRLQYLGDGAEAKARELCSERVLAAAATTIAQAVARRQPLPVRTTSRPEIGTIHLSAVDRDGNFAALTLTHGGAFGARVTVPGLGLTLGHGMSRFDPHPEHPNAPGPHKRPLNNMCPTIVAHRGRPVLALGARGGRKIPNALVEVLLGLVVRGQSLAQAVAAPRLHTEGTLRVFCEPTWPAASREALAARGYQVQTLPSAIVSAVGWHDRQQPPETAMR
jgi:gamma-glutamyltranspeptidase/glutathione hydrolase